MDFFNQVATAFSKGYTGFVATAQEAKDKFRNEVGYNRYKNAFI